ncbi:MAG TPA: hypothetical protein VMV51_08940, partial [Gemmatimonadaceae bacterium]|nr:hypothetical protein [Gemmatimonadaceae bacterium]
TEGYLRDLEASYQRGAIRTYPLFPGRRLAKGRARPTATKPLGHRGALDLFHELEKQAGVAIVQGRGWYGVRRVSADLAEDVESDGRALNAITGHQSDEMRRRVYQARIRDEVLATASRAREAARELAIEAAKREAESGAAPVAPPPVSRWEQVREAKKARRRAARDAENEAGAADKPTPEPTPTMK